MDGAVDGADEPTATHERAVCSLCGLVAPGAAGARPPLTWATGVENGRPVLHCERCAREHVRAIESKLDSAWW